MATYKEGMSAEARTERQRLAHGDGDSGARSQVDDVASGMRDMAGSMWDVAGDMADQLPGVAATTREMMDQAARAMETSTTEALMAGTMLSLGLALGLLIGGGNRILVAFALLPAAAMGATLLDRQARTGTGGGSRPSR